MFYTFLPSYFYSTHAPLLRLTKKRTPIRMNLLDHIGLHSNQDFILMALRFMSLTIVSFASWNNVPALPVFKGDMGT